MSNVLRLAIVDPNDATREQLKEMLLSMDVVWLEAECARYEFFADVIEQTHPDIGVVSLDQDPEKALQLIENLRRASPDCSILVISNSNDGQLILRSMRSGAKEFLTRPVRGEDLVVALERIGSQQYSGDEGRTRGSQVIAVAGATGGVGTTSISVNLACALAAEERYSAALVDLDLSLGDADVFLDMIPDYTLVDVAQNISRLDFSLLKRSLTKHACGLYLLPRPVQLQDAELVTPESLHRVVGLLKATFSHLVIDLSKGFTPVDLVALEASDHVLLVTQLDLPCLRNVVRLLMSFDEIDGLKDKVKIVVNRSGLGGAGEISLKKAQETIGRDIFWQIPNDYRVMVEMRNNGVPLINQAPRAGLTQSIVGMSHALAGDETAESQAEVTAAAASSRGGRWLSFWPRSK
ncbi:MAG: response regulator [Pirellulaceae bacterium]|jgi:pilus assembly protein CpaE|nr:response regulator [Pirellulaceae bacterium]MDP7017828.1 response regulator [Pirellulaceae bacterium]